MRILIGHGPPELTAYHAAGYDIHCVKYGPDGRTPPRTIAEMLIQCPPDWKPDVYLHLSLGHFPLPTDIETFDGLTAAFVSDWDRWGRSIWAGVGFLDLVLADRNACLLVQRNGYVNTHFARLWSCEPELHRVLPDVERDIDILFCGMLCSSTWGERNLWLERIARLSERYRIVIATNVQGEDYVRLNNRARIVFNRGVSGATNARSYEASGCGALVFNESENAETREIFQDGVHCVYYDDTNLESLLDYYLTHNNERECIATMGRDLVMAEHTSVQRTLSHYAILAANLQTRYRPAVQLPSGVRKFRLALQIYNSSSPEPDHILRLLEQAEREGVDHALVLEARTAVEGLRCAGLPREEYIKSITIAIALARQAVQSQTTAEACALPLMTQGFLLAHYAEALVSRGANAMPIVVSAARSLMTAADKFEGALEDSVTRERLRGRRMEHHPHPLEGFIYPRQMDNFQLQIGRVFMRRGQSEEEWERAMLRYLAWRCRNLLSELMMLNGLAEEARQQAEAAVRLLPKEAESRLHLARYSAQTDQRQEAARQYRELIALMPLESEIWLEYIRVLTALGEYASAEEFVRDRLLVIAAIPSLEPMREVLLQELDTQDCMSA